MVCTGILWARLDAYIPSNAVQNFAGDARFDPARGGGFSSRSEGARKESDGLARPESAFDHKVRGRAQEVL